MTELNFDPAKASAENIEAFYMHLDTLNPEFAAILREHITKILPLPAQNEAAQRAQKRQIFNSAVVTQLDSTVTQHEPEVETVE